MNPAYHATTTTSHKRRTGSRGDSLDAFDSRLTQALEEYRELLKRSETPDRDTFLDRYPEIAAELAECLDGLEFVHSAAPELRAGLEAAGARIELPSPCTLGDFRIEREIGRGGMGVVYEAEQISLGRRVALKVLPFAVVLDERQLTRFRNEARAAAALHYEGIVSVFCVGCERGIHYYAMQLIEGQTLSQLIVRLRESEGGQRAEPATGLPAGQTVTAAADPTVDIHNVGSMFGSRRTVAFFRAVAELGVQAAESLEHAHGMGVVHRDVKPSNLILDHSFRLWLTDFGLARMGTNPAVTMSGDVVGTLRYMSPEQALAKHDLVDHRSDVYSLRATLYEY
jgi:hypothetical protein